jgi:RNA 2',3'-cyclic 3'-phosphodiesterase
MRLFVGIGLPTKIGERLVRAAHGLLPAEAGKSAGVRWTRPGNLHLTLSFLGQVEPARLKPIQRSLATLRAARLEIELGGVGASLASCMRGCNRRLFFSPSPNR